MPAPTSYYGPGSSVQSEQGELDNQYQHQPPTTSWKGAHHQQQQQHLQSPASPPPSYAGPAPNTAPGQYQQGYPPPLHQQEPLQVYAHHGSVGGGHPPPGVFEQYNQGSGYGQNYNNNNNGHGYPAPLPSPSPAPGAHQKQYGGDSKHHHSHSGHGGDGRGYPRPGGNTQVVYVDEGRDRYGKKKTHKDDVALGFCAGCAAACCCCGCVVM